MKKHPIITAVYALLCIAMMGTVITETFSELESMKSYINQYLIISWVTIVAAILISVFGFLQAKAKGINRYVFYFALVFILPIPSLLYHQAYCQGKWCNMLDYLAVMILAVLAVSIVVIYYLGKFLVKKGFLHTFLKYFYILICVLLVIEVPLLVASGIFDYSFVGYTFNTGDYLFGEVTLPNDFIDTAMVIIPALIFALYPLKIADAEYEDKE